MTDAQIMQRFIKSFGNKLPEFEDIKFWDSFANGVEWFNTHYPDSDYAKAASAYYRAYMEIATIDYMLNKRGGFVYDTDGMLQGIC